jgi:hypothetical protein
MTTHLTRPIKTPIRTDLETASDIWDGPDRGLIFCWECGRKERKEKPELAFAAKHGELVPVGSRLRPTINLDADESDDATLEQDDDQSDEPEAEGTKSQKKGPKRLGIWKRGSLQYLAWWQGLRGDDLDISFVEKIEIVCPRIFENKKGRRVRRKYFFPRRKPSAFDDIPVS